MNGFEVDEKFKKSKKNLDYKAENLYVYCWQIRAALLITYF